MILKNTFDSIAWLINKQFNLHPRLIFNTLRGIPRFIHTYHEFTRSFDGLITLKPCLHDWFEAGGDANNEYFLQDLYVARLIRQAQPDKHMDIGSRVDGFVANVASFREVEVIDIRPIQSNIDGIRFRQADIMDPYYSQTALTDSLSCLHAFEHFGLGRYGDKVNSEGYKQALHNIASLIVKCGVFYLSVPVGREKVEFNAHRIFDPVKLTKQASLVGLELQSLTAVYNKNLEHFDNIASGLETLRNRNYSLGIFTFKKLKN